MFDWINPLYAWIGLGGTIIAACVAVAIYFPPLRKIAIAVGGDIAALNIVVRHAFGRSGGEREGGEQGQGKERTLHGG